MAAGKCPWCQHTQTIRSNHAVYCSNCLHRIDVARSLCDCLNCIEQRKHPPEFGTEPPALTT